MKNVNDDLIAFRVWPCGTVQVVEDGEPYSFLSDDFEEIFASSEEEAVSLSASFSFSSDNRG